MELDELTAYAKEKYRIEEQHKWADFPGFSVLCHPTTGKWIALLMRQWDTESGTELERCDLKCGDPGLLGRGRPYLTSPLRMKGPRWTGVTFDRRTEPEVVFRLFDRAITAGEPRGFTVVLEDLASLAEKVWHDTPLPSRQDRARAPISSLPPLLEKLRKMRPTGRESMESRAKNFCRQALLMRDYEDDLAWTGDFVCYFPTYQDMDTRQLRGYFSWRARVRRGEYPPIPASAAYLYVYELLNGVGASSPEDALRKLKAFDEGFCGAGYGDERMRANLRRWMPEYAVVNALPSELIREYADPDMMARDSSLAVLQRPEANSDEDVFSALCVFGGKKTAESPVIRLDPVRGRHLFSEAWRAAAFSYRREGQDLFTLCFGNRAFRPWYPLSNAVVAPREERPADLVCEVDPCRTYRRRNGVWEVSAYEGLHFDRALLQGFLHEADLLLRRYLKAGHYLREKPEEAWAVPFIQAAIAEDREAVREASRPKITIDLADLERIRRDAAVTRESLLTDPEEEAPEHAAEPEMTEAAVPPADEAEAAPPQDRMEVQILRALLAGKDTAEIIRAHHTTASLAADSINELLFEEFGDTVLLCEDDKLALVDDYIEDLAEYLEGASHGGA